MDFRADKNNKCMGPSKIFKIRREGREGCNEIKQHGLETGSIYLMRQFSLNLSRDEPLPTLIFKTCRNFGKETRLFLKKKNE